VKSLRNNNYRRSFDETDRDLSEMSDKSSILKCLPDFVPQKTDKSNIMTEGMMSVLTHHLPMNYRLLPWHLLYSIERDGYSHHTFFDKVARQCAYVLLVRDSLNHVFGAFLSQTIKNRSVYTGDGDCFVFTFHDDEDLEVFGSTGRNSKFQFTDDEFIIIGGASDDNGRAAIVISDRFTRGHSSPCVTFDNSILCGNSEDEKYKGDDT